MNLNKRQKKLLDRLVEIENRHGLVKLPYVNRSVDDPRPKKGNMQGGDRMSFHGYGPVYAKYLDPFLDDPPRTIIEVGVLTGIGLHIWTELFPDARVIGLDIDLSNVDLSKFDNKPELYHFDMFEDNTELMDRILAGDQADIVVDDGAHVIKANLITYNSISPFLSARAVYFIEDTIGIQEHINYTYNQGRITVI